MQQWCAALRRRATTRLLAGPKTVFSIAAWHLAGGQLVARPHKCCQRERKKCRRLYYSIGSVVFGTRRCGWEV
jgi:hypothetical protein